MVWITQYFSRITLHLCLLYISRLLLIINRGSISIKREKRDKGQDYFGHKILNGHSLIIPVALTPFVYLSSVERLIYHGRKYFINVSLLP